MPNPPDHWTSFSTDGLTSAQVLTQLNTLALEGYYSVAVYVPCTDGNYVFVGGYSD